MLFNFQTKHSYSYNTHSTNCRFLHSLTSIFSSAGALLHRKSAPARINLAEALFCFRCREDCAYPPMPSKVSTCSYESAPAIEPMGSTTWSFPAPSAYVRASILMFSSDSVQSRRSARNSLVSPPAIAPLCSSYVAAAALRSSS